jgi:hypothetical protein
MVDILPPPPPLVQMHHVFSNCEYKGLMHSLDKEEGRITVTTRTIIIINLQGFSR